MRHFFAKMNKIMTIFRKYINCQLFRTMISKTIFAAISTKDPHYYTIFTQILANFKKMLYLCMLNR